jgi:hypothetical protein
VGSVTQVRELVKRYKASDIKHKLLSEDDYIASPKISGYRSFHLIYRYFSDKKATHNGLRIEVQIRSQLQHAWATAVETVGTFIQQALKSSQGEADWLRFFTLMGTALAIREDSPRVPNTPLDNADLKDQLQAFAHKLDVARRLTAYGEALNTVDQLAIGDADYYLLELDPVAMKVSVAGYQQKELGKASADYLAMEKKIRGTGTDAVLVSVESMASLRKAYPNYFLDTAKFVEAVKLAIG